MPIYLFDLETPISAEAARARMRDSVGPPRVFLDNLLLRFDSAREITPLFGSVKGESFWVWRRITYGNPFLPIIWGRIITLPVGVRIRVAMFLNPLAVILMLVWLSVTGVVALLSFSSQGHVNSYVPAAMFIFGVTVLCIWFFLEAMKARRLLEAILAETRA